MSSPTDFILQETCLCILAYLHTRAESMRDRSEQWEHCAEYINRRIKIANEPLRSGDMIPTASLADSDGGKKA